MFVSLITLMVLGIPIAWALCASSVMTLTFFTNLPAAVIAQRLFTGVNSFTLLAVPAFMVAGEIMSKGGIAHRLIDMADAIVGRTRGGLAMVSIVACTFFAALTGSSIATTAAIGGIMYPEMVRRKYPEDFSAAVQSIGGTLGPVIPPSVLFILYGNSVNVSIPDLLMSGVLPGVVSCVGLCIVCYLLAIKLGIGKSSEGQFDVGKLIKSIRKALLALFMPLIILGGIYCGVFTPTESAGVAVAYGLLISVCIYKEMNLKELLEVFKTTAVSTANMTILIMGAQLFGWIVAYANVPTIVGSAIQAVANSQTQFLILVIFILLVFGMFMDGGAIILIIAPIIHPIAMQYGLDPIHFGLVAVFTIALGNATPPFGNTLYVATAITKRPFANIARNVLPFVFEQVALCFVFAFVPFFATWLPGLM